MLDQTFLFVMTETAPAHDTHDNSEIELSGSAPCTFQDITGQRVTKVVRSMKFVEERVNSMVELLGRETIEKLSTDMPAEEKTEEEKLLEGPQMAGAAISQDNIDALFD
jgi:chemotaxis protein CheZ